jgi:hypothetical protein
VKVSRLPRYPSAIPSDPPVCAACSTFRPEVVVSTTPDTHAALCWICAHHVVEHGAPVAHARVGECECAPEAIYPDRRATLEACTKINSSTPSTTSSGG